MKIMERHTLLENDTNNNNINNNHVDLRNNQTQTQSN